jgi:hypothetical protein
MIMGVALEMGDHGTWHHGPGLEPSVGLWEDLHCKIGVLMLFGILIT